MSYVAKQLRKAASTFEERGKAYGDSRKVGRTISELYELFNINNVRLSGEQVFLLTQILLKLQRWVNKPQEPQNEDNLRDLIVYSAMLHQATYQGTDLEDAAINDAANRSGPIKQIADHLEPGDRVQLHNGSVATIGAP